MGLWMLTTEKQQGFLQEEGVEFSNVYTLSTPVGVEIAGEAAINSIVNLEKKVHGSNVSFTRGTIYVKRALQGWEPFFGLDLGGAGQATAGVEIYRECALLFQFELPRSGGLVGIGRTRRLSKWLHTGRLPGVGGFGPEVANALGTVPFNANYTNALLDAYARPLRNQEHGGAVLTNTRGDRPIDVSLQGYLEHRQFHRGRKEK